MLERVKSAAAAGQARAAAALDELRRADEAVAGVPADRRGRGMASEVALARQDSPARGSRHLGFAKALVYEMPHTLAALECGAISEWRATLIVRESACLDVEDRRLLDGELCADVTRLDGMGDARITAAAKEIAYRLDAQTVVDRAAKAEADRTVTIRPAPDTMTYVTALLPVVQGVGVYAALNKTVGVIAQSNPDERSTSTMSTITTTPDVPLPEGAFLFDEGDGWEDSGGEYRLVWGDARSAESTNFVVQPWATQLPDGSVLYEGADDQDVLGARGGIHVDEIRDGVSYDCLTVTVEGARGLAAALLAAADEVDAWAGKPTRPERLAAALEAVESAHAALIEAAATSSDPGPFYNAAAHLVPAKGHMEHAAVVVR